MRAMSTTTLNTIVDINFIRIQMQVHSDTATLPIVTIADVLHAGAAGGAGADWGGGGGDGRS